MDILFNTKVIISLDVTCSLSRLQNEVKSKLGIPGEHYYLLHNGKAVSDHGTLPSGNIHLVPRLVGGKGGFGSMLRAIGAQIEKTTNREACRDLSGRRLRDINEEQRLKNWVAQQAEREKEAAERRRKKLERLRERPKHEFKDEEYNKQRLALSETVEDAVTQGLQASCSAGKRKHDEEKKPAQNKKKPKLWFDEPEISGSDDDSDSDSDEVNKSKNTKSDSKNSDVQQTSEDSLEADENPTENNTCKALEKAC